MFALRVGVDDAEWESLNNSFHDEYFARVPKARLTVDASEAMTAVDTMRWGQSLLSMSTQEKLELMVASRGLTDRFLLIDGLRVPTGGLKAGHLADHLKRLDLAPSSVVVVGDTPDDASAARQVGAQVVLYDGGSHHLLTLTSMGTRVAHTLVEAVEITATL